MRLDSSRALGRLACLAALFTVELLIISTWLDTGSLSGGQGLVALVHDWGPWAVRVSVVFVVFSLLFAAFTAKSRLLEVPVLLAEHPIAWRLLVAHLGAMLLFTGLSWFLFESRPNGISADITVVGWVASGLCAIVLAALAFAPAAVWLLIITRTRGGWAYGLAAALGAYLLGNYAREFWQPLSRETFALVQVILRPLIPGLISDPATLQIGSPVFMVQIAKECSGYEGIGLVLTLTAIWLWFLRREWRFPQALLLLPAGAFAIWVLNAIRIALLILIGHAGAPEIALGGFHSQAGWIMFTSLTIGFCVLARRLPWMNKIQPEESLHSPTATRNPAVPYLMPFLVMLAASLISRSAMADFEWFYPLRVLAALATLWFFRDAYRSMNWRIGWPALAIGGLVFCIWIALERFGGGAHGGAMPAALAESSPAVRFTWLGFRVFGAVVTVPLAEELAYRGFLIRWLASRDFESVGWRSFSWLPFLISSAAFGVLHGERWLAGTIAGFFYAFALLRKGSIGEAVVAHATTNALLAAWVLLAGNWELW